MQKQLLQLCAVLVLTTATPHYYRQHYQYEQQSESYKNNELQHKKEEAGRYAKIEDGTSAPIEKSAFHQSEYHAPGADDDSSQARLSLTGHGGSGTGNTQRYQQQSSFRREWSQQNAGTAGGVDVGGTGSGHGYGHLGHRSQISGTGTASQSLTSTTGSGSQGIYGTDNSGFANRGHTHHSGRGHHRHHSQSLTGDSTTGTASHSLTSETQTNRRYGGIPAEPTSYPGNIRAVPVVSTIPIENPESSSVVPTSHRREWHHHASYNTQGTNQHPGRGHGYGVGHQTGRGYHHNHGIVRNVDSTRSDSSVIQQKEETQREYGIDGSQTQHIVHVGDVDHGRHGPGRGYGHHGRGRGRGHHEYGRGLGHGHPKYPTEALYTSYPQRQHTDLDDNTQTGQVSGTSFHSTSGINSAAQNAGTTFYSESSGSNTASQSKLIGTGIDSNRHTPGKPSGTGTVYYGESYHSGTNTNKQHSDVDDSSTTYGTGTVPLTGVTVPSTQSVGTGTVTHQTSRTYSVSQSKLSGISVPQTTSYGGSGRPLLISPTGPAINQGDIRRVPTPTGNIKPVYEPEPEAEEPSSNDKDRLRNVFEEVNRIALEDASLVKEQQSTGVTLKPVQVQQRPTTNQQTAHQSRTIYQSSGYTRTHGQTQQKVEDLTQQNEDDYDDTKDLTQQTEDVFDDLTQQSQHGFEDLTQQSQHGFDGTTQQVQKEYKFTPINIQQKPINLNNPKIDNQERTYTSQHTQTGFGKLDTKDLTQQTEDEYDDLTQQSQHGFDDLTQQTQHGFDETAQKEYKFTPINTQENPTNLDIPKIENQERTYTSRQTHRQYQTQQSQHGIDDTQQVQKEYTFTPINTQQKPKTDIQQEGTSSRQRQRLYHSQGRVEKTEFAAQPQEAVEAVTPEPAAGYWKITRYQTQQNKTQQPQTGYGKLEFSGQQHENDQKDLTQQHEDVFSQQQDLTQHQTEFEFNTQQTQNKFDKVGQITQHTQDGFGQISVGDQYQQPQYSSGRVVKISQQNEDLTKQSQKTDDLGTALNTDSKVQGSGYSTSSSYSRSSSYSTQHQPQVIYSPLHFGTKAGQMQVYQTMQIPAGASEEMKRKLEEQLKHQLELKMQELQSQQQSSQYSMSPVHIGTQSGTGQLQVYQTMQIPAGASEELKHKLEQQLRQQLEQKMQELRLQQQGRTEFHQSSSQPILVQSYSTGEDADCDEQTGGSYSSSYSSSSGTVGGNHYSMKLRPSSAVSSSGSSFQMSRQMQHPGSGYSYFNK